VICHGFESKEENPCCLSLARFMSTSHLHETQRIMTVWFIFLTVEIFSRRVGASIPQSTSRCQTLRDKIIYQVTACLFSLPIQSHAKRHKIRSHSRALVVSLIALF
jgi:hypothetical protein